MPSLAAVPTLSDYRYESRIVISRFAASSHIQPILARLDSQSDELAERRLRVFLVSENEVSEWKGENIEESLQQEIIKRLGDFHTLLIGFDGDNKSSYESLDLPRIFVDIDGMPMRRLELNK